MIVRRLAHALGYRFRLHRADLPGKPDLIFPSRRKIIFVHGCFWHGHDCVRGSRKPKSNLDYWKLKLERNKERDSENIAQLEMKGWLIMAVWECETKDQEILKERLLSFLA
jgi:DNA mismatch endonuclease (patch repair protein)